MFLGWERVDAKDVLEHLKRLKEFFSEESKWIYWPEAVESNNFEVDYNSAKAIKWSLSGASQLLSEQSYKKPMCDFIDCATREFIKTMSDGKYPETYDEEYFSICLAIEKLKEELKC